MTHRQATDSVRAALALIVLAWTGCGGLALERSLQRSSEDWPGFGSDLQRTGASALSLRPPLRLAWSQDIAGGVGAGSPVVIDSVVLLGTMRGDLYALHAGTGKTLGWINLGEAIHGSPAVDRFLAVVALANTKASLVSYDFYEGTVRWRQALGDLESTPLQEDTSIYVGNLQGIFFCVASEDGRVRWHYSIEGNSQLKGIRSSAALDDGVVVFGADDGALYALNAHDGSLRWRTPLGAPIWATPSISAQTVIVGTIEGILAAVDLSTGAERWRTALGTPVYAGALVVDDRAVVGTLGGSLQALELESGNDLWKTDTGSPLNAQMVAASGIGYLGTLGRELLAVDLRSGEILWRETLAGRVKSAGAIAFGRLFVATDDRELVAFQEDRP